MTMSVSDLALADSACFSASALTFFGRPTAKLLGFGPNALPPPLKIGAFLLP
jgi:hypothetical protein